jgi:hypothetical protein
MRWLLAFAALALTTSCSKKSDPLESKLATVQGFCDEWAGRACSDAVVQSCSAESANACIESQRAFCETLIPDGKYSELTARDCLAAVEAAYGDGILTANERDTVRQLGNECDHILSGSGTAGKSCVVDSDCDRDEDLACVKKTSTIGKCEKPPDKPIGGGHDCSPLEAVCEDGFYCDGSNCLAAKSVDDPCSATIPCDSASRCLDADDNVVGASGADAGAAMGICRARKAVGNGCTGDDDCTTRICTPKAGSTDGVCSKQVVLSPADPICSDLQ